ALYYTLPCPAPHRLRPSSPTRRSSDLVVVVRDAALGEKLAFLQNAVGAVAGPFDSFLALRGLKTLHLRMESLQATQRKEGIERRSEEHTSELQSLRHLVCRLLLEKKKN